jgi:mRNA-degrading endonuclease RelE of RelBE toxin-antitoxin system
MQLIETPHFKRDYKKLPPQIQKRTDEKLKLLVQNISHPSLRIKKVQKYKGVFEGSITKDYRFLFQITTEGYILLRIGTHDILEKG